MEGGGRIICRKELKPEGTNIGQYVEKISILFIKYD